MLRLGRENVGLDPTVPAGPIVSAGQSREYELKSEIEILKSRDLIEKVVDTIGPATFLDPPEEMIERSGSIGEMLREGISDLRQGFRRILGEVTGSPKEGTTNLSKDRNNAIQLVTTSLNTEALKNSNIIVISFEAVSRKLAQETVNKLIGFFLEKHMNVYRPEGSYEFFNKQTADSRKSLIEAEEDLRTMKNSTGIASLEEQKKVLFQRIGDLQRNAEETRSALAASRAKVLTMEKTLVNLPPTVIAQETNMNMGVEQMRARFYELQLKEQDLLSRYNENSKPVQEVRRQIVEAQALLAKEERTRTQVTRAPNEAYKQIESALLAERSTLSGLQAKIEVVQ
jgi:uncharacterized protein involved in exopolysaccharide biosynthesis